MICSDLKLEVVDLNINHPLKANTDFSKILPKY